MYLYSVVCVLELGSNIWDLNWIRYRKWPPFHQPSINHLQDTCTMQAKLGGSLMFGEDTHKTFVTVERAYWRSTVNVFDPNLGTWQEQHTTGVPPHGLCHGAYTSHKKILYSFAGNDGVSAYMNSLHALDTDMLVWKDVSSPNGPMPKSACGMVFFGNHYLATIATHTAHTAWVIFHQGSWLHRWGRVDWRISRLWCHRR